MDMAMRSDLTELETKLLESQEVLETRGKVSFTCYSFVLIMDIRFSDTVVQIEMSEGITWENKPDT